MLSGAVSIWRTTDGVRYYLIPDAAALPMGDLHLTDMAGRSKSVCREFAGQFEITEQQARRIASDQLARTLDELKHGMKARFFEVRELLAKETRTPVAADTDVTPDTVHALVDFVKKLPGVIAGSLAGDSARLGSAKRTMADLQQRMEDAGIPLDRRFTDFPDRLALLRAGFGRRGAAAPELHDKDKRH